ncbi:DnaB-like helicase N-terminal domain-containing protein [Streptomyces sp. NPDC059832]|uniref:DnaB-like helicase N-terminal domain-containing protein n=1 Tax=Streptomyces sp. NPDC059832 TaxID=3346966 RepID=UPI0036599621
MFDEALDIPAQQLDESPEAVSVSAETAVLGACLMATGGYDPIPGTAQILSDDGAWYRPHHEAIWRAIFALHGRSKPTGVPMAEGSCAAVVT